MSRPRRTRVGIIGAGPAGLLLGHLLHRQGIDTVVLEARTRDYVERRQRAGILEQGTIDVLRECGAGARMDQEGLRHDGIELRFDRQGHRIDFPSLTGGRSVMVYAQTEVVKDLIALRLEAGAPLLFEAEALAVEDFHSTAPRVRYRHEDAEHVLECDVVVACDGFHGIGRRSLPADALRVFEREYPFSWLGILADVPPSCDELIYAHHERGFALHSMRSPKVSRLYLQVDRDETVDAWSDDRIWDELATRFAVDDDWALRWGPITDKGITPMRSFVAEPLRHGRLFLAGDAAHIVPPTGAKGLNLAVADVTVLASALVDWFAHGNETALDSYSDTALRRVWRAEHFSYLMTTMLHRDPREDAFGHRLQLSQLRYTVSSTAAATSLAENYVGLPLI
ncbi:p-hydroxybenzoate 3-monooxygenase [Streptoalloteichus tenebrarius]|uniref:p-hydroxybenzoate 3-monooxygenase n=1 Tax=Streptoalloteichus tenebrarius (strain ATCC 17920 / DSM 40477 / JCM 4838 / CBS 697.72 / NBRC 16177 / NCIMB 11028 / NRRL B-12390 / A12253. 1 / ISP 5477) TaxID=1933 RepID=A0ABT1HLX8_STRSD|nr:4-hydroxybenzoate 3-monooxygenase [Streptoalloteichus tenebrarius]MCP2256503.1 p-hydroxybenzoate 3-monooxygenase [Streptoalloteichus tenebrarius]BFF04855.1 4-hydroxybenzoate 3-monooxygenase [Streptoalloteichus tenebrarius]